MLTELTGSAYAEVDFNDLAARGGTPYVLNGNGGRILTEDELTALTGGYYHPYKAIQADQENDIVDSTLDTTYGGEPSPEPNPSVTPTPSGVPRIVRIIVGLLILLVLIFLPM